MIRAICNENADIFKLKGYRLSLSTEATHYILSLGIVGKDKPIAYASRTLSSAGRCGS